MERKPLPLPPGAEVSNSGTPGESGLLVGWRRAGERPTGGALLKLYETVPMAASADLACWRWSSLVALGAGASQAGRLERSA